MGTIRLFQPYSPNLEETLGVARLVEHLRLMGVLSLAVT
jgi:hypothetical protein